MSYNQKQETIRVIAESSMTPELVGITNTMDEGSEQVAATTTFNVDSGVVTNQEEHKITINRDLYDISTDNYTQEIKTFLAKPFAIYSNSFAASQSVSTFPDIAFPNILFTNTLMTKKLEGFFGFRATLVFTINVNASRFQQGRYIMAWIPTGGAVLNTKTQLDVDAHKNTITQRTQLQRVEIDLNCITSGILRVPFVSVLNHTPIQSYSSYTGGSMGYLHISPYVSLVAASGQTTANFVVMCHLEDVELVGVATPESGKMDEESITNGVKRVLISTKEVTDKLKEFPVLSAYVVPVAWATDLSLSTMKSLGWSKPLVNDPTEKVIRDVAPSFCNSDKQDTSKVNAAFVSNSVGLLPGSTGRDIDELAFTYIATKPAYIGKVDWPATALRGTLIESLNVSPNSNVATRTVTGGFVVTDYTPLQFVSSHFHMWRGSISYTFKLVKTEFHSGRLAVVFFPLDYNTRSAAVSVGASANFANTPYVHREIIDIREHNEFTINIPFIHSAPFVSAFENDDAGTPSDTIGLLQIYVETQLAAPNTVSQTITILEEHAGGPDIEFAVPCTNNDTPMYNVTPQSGMNECSILERTLGSATVVPGSTHSAEACIGEKVVSFRTLLKMTNQLPLVAGLLSTTKCYWTIPYANPACYNLGTNMFPVTAGDLYGRLCSCFLMSRGSINFKFLQISGTRPLQATLYFNRIDEAFNVTGATATPDGKTPTTAALTNQLTTFHHTRDNYVAEVKIPQYIATHSRLNSTLFVNTNSKYNSFAPSTAPSIIIQTTDKGLTYSAQTETSFYRAMGEDGNMGHFISIPPMHNMRTTVQ